MIEGIKLYFKSDFNKLLNDIILRKRKLSYSESYRLMSFLLHSSEMYSIPTWTAFFASIQTRGPTEEEILGFLEAFREFTGFEVNNFKKPRVLDDTKTISLVGSGKDDIKTINVSTITSIVLASMKKIKVIKHGSYGGASIYGSRDILDAFGIDTRKLREPKINILRKLFIYFLPIEEIIEKFDKKYGGNFLFFHPLSYVIAGVLNPYYLDWLVMGITDFNRTSLSGGILSTYGYRGVVVSGEVEGYGYIDEASPFGISKICYFDENNLHEKIILPHEIFGKKFKPLKYIFQTKDLNFEKKKFEEILKGNAPLEAKALIAINSGIALSLFSRRSLAENVKESLEVIDSGEPYETWEKLRQMLYEEK